MIFVALDEDLQGIPGVDLNHSSCQHEDLMKAARSGYRGAAAKDVEEYLSGVPEPARGILQKMRAAIRSVVPAEATETISYGIPAFKHRKVLVWFAAFSDHCSLFPTAAIIEMFKKELQDFSTSKGTIHFPIAKPLPLGLIKKLVKARVKQNEGRLKR
jgi:uncharacterized protein YdhG (YjbR/CyaY superfamily)